MDVLDTVGAPCANTQITNKVFSIISKVDVFHDGVRELKRKLLIIKRTLVLTSFCCRNKRSRKNNKIISKTVGHQISKNTSQALLEKKNNFKYFTS